MSVVVARHERATLRVGDVACHERCPPTDVVTPQRPDRRAALRPWTPVLTHGDLQVSHVFVDGSEVTGVIDWSEAGPGDALVDLATLTLDPWPEVALLRSAP